MKNSNKTLLFCISFAGGSSMSYLGWKKYLHNSIQIYAVERAGRGTRINTPFYNSINEEAEDVFNELKKNLHGISYALFGHSMGVIVIYELMNKIYQNGIQKPIHIFLSGRNPLHINKNRNFHILPDNEFILEISKYGCIPSEILNNEELCNIFLPVIRADIKNIETYNFIKYNRKWDVDISVFNGDKDNEVEISRCSEWRDYTTGQCSFYTFKGGHFFIYERTEEIFNIMNRVLLNN